MNRVKYIVYSLVCFGLCLIRANAASIEMSVTSSTITKGASVTVNAIFKSNNSIFFTEGKLSCSGAGVSASKDLGNDDMSDGNKSKSFSLSIKPTTTGKVTCSISGARMTDSGTNGWINVSTNAKTITVNAPASTTTPSKPKSSNNYLTSLTIDGYELDKTFSKNTLEYNVEIKPEDEKINVNAQTADSTAKVTGTGEITLNPGSNKIEIKVTAQNGNVKTYIINATLKEYKNIEVNIDNKKYSIVRKEGLIDKIKGYEKTTIKIEDEEVLAYHNEKTKYDLVILKDEDDKYNYYVYKDSKYTLYKEYDFSGTKLFIIDKELNKDKKNNFISSEFTIGEDKIKAYQVDKSKKNETYALDDKKLSNYYLVYAMNINTGNEGYYLIDNKENTAIRYSDEIGSFFAYTITQNNNDSKYKNYFFIALGVFGLTILVMGISSIVKSKKNKHKYSNL